MSPNTPPPKNDPKVINGWLMFDWANSVYALTITTAIFPLYYQAATESAFGGNEVDFFGLKVNNDSLYSYALSFSFLVIGFASPLLSGIADYSSNKKAFMQFFVYLGAISCAGMAWFDGQNIEYGIACSVLASIGYAGSIVFYNAYLPEIATPDRFDEISAKGFSVGYIGGVVLLVINLIPILFPYTFYDITGKAAELVSSQGISEAESIQKALGYYSGKSSRIAFLTVALWWTGFSLIAFHRLPTPIRAVRDTAIGASSIIYQGYRELAIVWRSFQSHPDIKYFLLAFGSYNAGVQTVMYLATTYAQDKYEINLGLSDDELIICILLIQLVAIPGAQLFARISQHKGNYFALRIMLVIWIGICIAAYAITDKWHFYALAVTVGIVMGGIQATSRATYTKLIPVGITQTASYFSFYDFLEKISIVLGTFTFGLMNDVTGSLRMSTLAVGVFFLIGITLIQILIKRNKTVSQITT